MAFIEIVGGKQLNGEVNIQGSKNAVLPILAATVLVNGITKLNHCPKILDVFSMIKILEAIGCRTWWESSSLLVDTTGIFTSTVPEEDVKKMRSSIILMGALLGRTGSVNITYPGGCTIGARPIDYHLKAFEQMNVCLKEEDGLINCSTNGIKGNDILLKFPSVGATENIILAAVLATGKTRIFNAAMEPEIFELCKFLTACGAKIFGAGTNRIEVDGVDFLHCVEFTAASDRIVAGTYLAAVAGCGGEAILTGIGCGCLHSVIVVLRSMGCGIVCGDNYIIIASSGRLKSVPSIKTAPYPGFPTDMQSQIMSLLMTAQGVSTITEEIFEDRYQNATEQLKFGANILVNGRDATIYGVEKLTGCEVCASELRGGAALVIDGLMASGKTIIRNPNFIQRGYEDICRDFSLLGADIKFREET